MSISGRSSCLNFASADIHCVKVGQGFGITPDIHETITVRTIHITIFSLNFSQDRQTLCEGRAWGGQRVSPYPYCLPYPAQAIYPDPSQVHQGYLIVNTRQYLCFIF